MAETHDTRAWQAGVDPALVTRLQRPLRRSAAIACAWAREALARGKRGGLPLFASWAVRWGMNEAAVAGLRPIVHALPHERAPEGVVAPAIAAVQARLAPETPRTAIVAVARAAATGEREAIRGGTHEGSQHAASERGAPIVAMSERPHEVVRSEPAASQPAVPRVDGDPRVAAPTAMPAATTGLDLRVDPALLVAATLPSATTVPPRVVHAPASESGPPMRPRTRPRLLTTMDLARAQQLAASSQPSATIAATAPPVTPPREAPASMVVEHGRRTHELDEAGADRRVAPQHDGQRRRRPRARRRPPSCTRQPSSSAAPALDAASATIALDLATSSAVAPLRVRGRVVAAPVSPVLVDSLPNNPAARPRVSLASPTLPSSPGLTAASSMTATQPAASRIDVTLPAAQPSTSPPPAARTPPAARPVVARVETSQLDIPAIAQAVHRHLERELRWERERRGGRP
ncbi:hypothetical protein [Nannocystis sp.]|uniref:hypothetical protein n=1 Tax=Nannocystis sp. TaxID=1962667 RepID=UPI0025DBDE59|nr:hypothetical protein [Nannocystis sp.]MBK7825894.1 hypothetical protein [Nannocystis sp.]